MPLATELVPFSVCDTFQSGSSLLRRHLRVFPWTAEPPAIGYRGYSFEAKGLKYSFNLFRLRMGILFLVDSISAASTECFVWVYRLAVPRSPAKRRLQHARWRSELHSLQHAGKKMLVLEHAYEVLGTGSSVELWSGGALDQRGKRNYLTKPHEDTFHSSGPL